MSYEMALEILPKVIEAIKEIPVLDMTHWHCGTSYCAWGAFIVKYGSEYSCFLDKEPAYHNGESVSYGMGSIKERLEISYQDCWDMFSLDWYESTPTKLDVITRIESYIRRYNDARFIASAK